VLFAISAVIVPAGGNCRKDRRDRKEPDPDLADRTIFDRTLPAAGPTSPPARPRRRPHPHPRMPDSTTGRTVKMTIRPEACFDSRPQPPPGCGRAHEPRGCRSLRSLRSMWLPVPAGGDYRRDRKDRKEPDPDRSGRTMDSRTIPAGRTRTNRGWTPMDADRKGGRTAGGPGNYETREGPRKRS
jgi:hypothetical protein